MTRLAAVLLVCAGCDRAFGLTHVTDLPDAVARDVAPPLDVASDASVFAAVAHYQMDMLGSPATCLFDDSGHHHDGICLGGTPTVGSGKVGEAFHFDGATRIQIPTVDDVGGPGAFTIAGWINYDGSATCPFNRLFGTTGADSWQVCLELADTTFYFAGQNALVAAGVPANEWHQIAIAYTGTTVMTYLDGTPLGMFDGALSFDGSPIELGADVDSGGVVTGNLTGALDDIWIYDRALTQSEIQVLEVL